MIKDNTYLTGELHILLKSQSGEILVDRVVKNLVVTAGKSIIATALNTGTLTPFSYMAVGSSTTAADIAQTALVAEAATRVVTSNSVITNVFTMVGTFNPGVNTGTIGEAGLFNAAAAGDMLARTTFSAFVKGATDTLAITWNITVG